MNASGQQFGSARPLEAILQARSQPLQKSVATLLAATTVWQGTERSQDDLSILAVELSAAFGPHFQALGR